ncbi:carbohydrate ABC transporter permease [Eisenbergiella sp. OF01-20]|jgi:ABC-type glycerol-3-phosphate transport system permease component|nr:carbohydrate ABC transporter permease [Eisenbergiella sp. OF01-20]
MNMKRIKGMGSILRYLICIACVAVILLPIGILIHGSFQGGGIKNYVDILTKYHIETYFINSLIISVSVVVLVVVLDVLAGFALSKLNFPFKNGIYIFLLSALLLPAAAILVPVFQINSKLGILNTYLAVLGPYVVLIAPFNLLTIKNGFDALPNTVLEAALIDGCGIVKTLFKIAVPMCKPSIVMAVIWTFLSSWNEYMMAFVMLRKEEIMTITVIPTKFQSMYGGNVGKLYAALFIILVPGIIIYLLMQKFIVNGLNAGAVKE